MSESDGSFLVLDETEITGAVLRRDPYDFCYVDQAICDQHKAGILDDVPDIPHRGSYGLPSLRYGRRFADVITDLTSRRFEKIVEDKFDTDLSSRHRCIVMMGKTTGHKNEGFAHPDSRHKIITVIVGSSREWPYERGRLRVLRSNNRQDCAFEFPPEIGKMLMFRVCDHSWHGFLPQRGDRASLQLCWVDTEWYVQKEYWRHRISAIAKAIPPIRKIIEVTPRRFLQSR